MHTPYILCLSLAVLLSQTIAIKAEAPEILPAICIEPVAFSDLPRFQQEMQAINARMSDQHDIPLFLRAYQSLDTQGGFTLIPALSFESLLTNRDLFSKHPDWTAASNTLSRTLQSSGSHTYLKAVRFDGTHTPGTLLNLRVAAKNESKLLETLERWQTQTQETVSKDIYINMFRVEVGDGSFSHLISFNTDGLKMLGQALDAQPSITRAISESEHGSIISQSLYQEVE
ncbi:MAG: hypothetical protein ACPGN3_02670 [Opitutales bacterium]